MSPARLSIATAAWLIAGAAFAVGNCAPGGADIACTEQGAVRGVIDGNMVAFKGIPYARPPVGALRWRPPEAAPAWEGVRDGSRYGAMCPQLVGKDVKGEEDCLYLNIWRARTASSTPLPVMVWLTGGGNHSLSGEGTGGFGGLTYNGERFVPNGVVFVSYNLRLGALGFLAHPALDAERPEKISGNYGSLDQIAMLRWLKQHIAAFGGDPQKIFLFGTSAGGGNICALMTSPLTRGLIAWRRHAEQRADGLRDPDAGRCRIGHRTQAGRRGGLRRRRRCGRVPALEKRVGHRGGAAGNLYRPAAALRAERSTAMCFPTSRLN